MQQKVNNRFREYSIALPSDLAEHIREDARQAQLSEQNLIKRIVINHYISQTMKELEITPQETVA